MRVILLILLLAPVGAIEVLSDASGDVESQLLGNADGETAMGSRGAFDLLSLDLSETPNQIHFALAFEDLTAENQDSFDSATLNVDFRHEDRSFRINVYRRVTDGDPSYWGQLQRYDGGLGYYVGVSNIEIDVDELTHILTARVERQDIQDSNGAAPHLGRQLEDFRVTSSMNSAINLGQVTSNLLRIWDNMPDSGVGTTVYEVVEGVQQSGSARLSSADPMRSSNGDATTFLYDVVAYNDAADETRFRLRNVQVPQGWQITLPSNEIRINGESQLAFKVLVSVPFAHEHGGYEAFTLELQSLVDGKNVGRVSLGVRFLEVPQPAGHHDTVYLHSRTEPLHVVNDALVTALGKGCLETFPYFNTNEEDDLDEEVEIPACYRNFYGTGTRFQWNANLEPGLALGMDWILNETGDVQVDFASSIPLNSATLSGTIIYIYRYEETANGTTYWVTEWMPVADLLPSTPGSIQGTGSLSTVVQPRDEADLLPYRENSELRFEIRLDVAQPDPTIVEQIAPRMVAATLQLPLAEYQDLLVGSVSLSDMSLKMAGPAERKVNPGETVLFNFTLTNDAPIDDRIRLRVVGPNAAWATVTGEEVVDVVSGRERRVTVAVSAPSDAVDQTVAELILSAVSTKDASIQLTRAFAATVDTVSDLPDERHYVQSQGEKQSPIGLFLVVVALALVARRVK